MAYMKRFAFKMYLKPGCEQECAGEGSSQDTDHVDPITQKWWDMMADIMEVNPDNSTVTVPLQEVFHLD